MTDQIRILAIFTQSKDAPSPAIQDQFDELAKLGISIDVMPIDQSNKINYLKVALRVFLLNFRPKRFDLIHAFYGHCGLVARPQLRMPVVVTFQGSDILGNKEGQNHHKDGMIGDIALKLCQGVIVMSEQMKELSGRSDAVIIPFGINTNIFYEIPQIEARQRLGIEQGKLIVLFPWSPDRPEKRFEVAESAVEILVKRGLDVQLLPIWGQSRENVALYMNASDALVLVSDHEGSPVAVREAMACNLPIVSVDVGDVSVLLDGITPSAIVERMADDVANALQDILEKRVRSNGHEKISTLDAKWSASKVLPIYDQALNK